MRATILVLGLLLTSPALGQDVPGAGYRLLPVSISADSTVSVIGFVRRVDGKPILGAQVSARPGGGERHIVGSDDQGRFEFHLPFGTYTFDAAKVYHRQLFVGPIRLGSGELLEIDFTLDYMGNWSHGPVKGSGNE